MLMMMPLYTAIEATPVGHTWQVKIYIHFHIYILLCTHALQLYAWAVPCYATRYRCGVAF